MDDATTIHDGRFIHFEPHPPANGRSTPTVDITSKLTGSHEGQIRWHGRRGFSLFPDSGTVFGPVCLGDVLRVIAYLNAEHEASRGR